MKRSFLYFFSFLLFFLCTSCKDEEFSNNFSLRLSYSADTIAFDTILADLTSPIRTLKIKNNSDENIRISSIAKAGGNDAFQLNINGRSGNETKNIELLSGDSLFIFVQCVSHESATDLLIMDSLIINYNGNTDRIILSAVSSMPTVFRNKVIESDTTISNERPFLVYGTLKISEGATLTIAEGVKMCFHNGGKIEVDGGLRIEGTKENRVKFRYFREDDMMKDLPYYRVSGSWKGIYLNKTCTDFYMLCADAIGGEYGLVIDSIAMREPIYIGNSKIENNKYGALVAEDVFIYAYNSVFANGGLYNVRLIGGKYLFNHCTIASYFNQTSAIRYPALSLSDREDDAHIIPMLIEINNCIIYGKGSSKPELYSESTPIAELPTETFKVGVYYSLVAGQEREDEEYFVKNRWNKDPKFNVDAGTYYADFSLDTLSSARTIADPLICRTRKECETDINGKNRIDDFYPDAGAYEY